MSKERPHPAEAFGLTEREQLWDRVSHKRFMELLRDEQTRIHKAELSTNMYGEFLFVSLSRPDDKPIGLTFYGAGFREQRERWITDEWFWYQTSAKTEEETLPKTEVISTIQERRDEIATYAQGSTQSARGKLFEMLAELTDEDAALSEMEDLSDFDWLDDG